jgi:anti-sigma factor RsiW
LAASLALLVGMPQIGEPGLADQLVDSHIRSLQASHLIDVATSDRHVVKPWFNGRIDYAPQVVDLKAQGFPLVGGRLDVVDQRTIAVLVYRRRLHSINVFVRPQPALVSPRPQTIRRDSYSIVRWTAGGLEYWAVSDLALDELDQFHRLFEKAAS